MRSALQRYTTRSVPADVVARLNAGVLALDATVALGSRPAPTLVPAIMAGSRQGKSTSIVEDRLRNRRFRRNLRRFGLLISTPCEEVHRSIVDRIDRCVHRVARLNCPCANGSARRGQPARLGRDGPVCGLLERSRHAHPMDPRRSWLRNLIGRRLPVALAVPAGLASEAVSSKKRPVRVNASPVDGSWRLDFAGAPHRDQYHCSSDERLNRQVLLHLPMRLFSRPARPTDDSQEQITIGRSHIARG